MDDKFIQLTIPWSTINETSEAALSAYVLKLMKNSRETAH